MNSPTHRYATGGGRFHAVINTLFGIAVTTLAASVAFAQDDATGPDAIEEIIVTGSLIRSPNTESASPIVSVGMSDLNQNGDTALIGVLNQLPQFNATSGVGSGGQGTGGHVTVNLRGLGSNRNLVLLAGRRLPLADINGNVVIYLVPESAIGMIDVITGGA
jgi:outer membrane cobalamin receptor